MPETPRPPYAQGSHDGPLGRPVATSTPGPAPFVTVPPHVEQFDTEAYALGLFPDPAATRRMFSTVDEWAGVDPAVLDMLERIGPRLGGVGTVRVLDMPPPYFTMDAPVRDRRVETREPLYVHWDGVPWAGHTPVSFAWHVAALEPVARAFLRRDGLDAPTPVPASRAAGTPGARALGMRTHDAFVELDREVRRARERYGSNAGMLPALVEEVAELAEALADGHPRERVVAEALQVACVALRIATEGDADFPASLPDPTPDAASR